MRCLAWVALGWLLMASAAFGQGFGQNKVQYAEFAWRKMETEHFDVYFFAEEEELAAYAAQMAERQFRFRKEVRPHRAAAGAVSGLFLAHLL